MTNPAATQNKEIDCLSPEAQRLAEARLAAKRAARAEAREIRMKELERQQKEVEDRPEKDFTEKGSRSLPGLSAATLASLGGTSSRRGSGDTSISVDTEASIREIKDSLAEVEEKYKKAMVSNAQLDNEKTNFLYQVDTLKDMLLELEEQLAESRRQYEEKNKEFEREKHAHSILQFQFAEVKEALKQREDLLEKHGIVLNSEPATNGEASDTLNNVGHQGPSKITKEELNALKTAGDGTLACHVSCHFLGTPLPHDVITRVLSGVRLCSAHHRWLKNTFLLLLKATNETVNAGESSRKLRDSSDSTIWFSSAMCQGWLPNLSVTDGAKDQSSRGCEVR